MSAERAAGWLWLCTHTAHTNEQREWTDPLRHSKQDLSGCVLTNRETVANSRFCHTYIAIAKRDAVGVAASCLGFGFSVPSGAKECFEEHAGASDHLKGSWSIKEAKRCASTWKVTRKENALAADSTRRASVSNARRQSERCCSHARVLRAARACISVCNVAVTSPTGDIIHASEKEQEGSFDYFAEEGVHVICFENSRASSADARPVVHASAKITVGDPPDLIQLAKT